MNARRLRFALAAVAIGLVAVGAVLTASNGQSSRTSARPSATSDGDMPAALASHLAKLSQAIPGKGGEPAGESSGPGTSTAALEEFAQLAYPKKDVPLSSLKAARAAFKTARARALQRRSGREREPSCVAAGGPGNGAVPVHAVPGRALVHAAGVRGGRSHDRPRHRPELRPDAGTRAPRREVPDVDHARPAEGSGARTTRWRRTRTGSTWAGASGSTRPGRSRSTRTIRARTRSGSEPVRATRAAAVVSQASASTSRPTAATTGRARTAPRRSTPAVSGRSGSSPAIRTRSMPARPSRSADTRPCAATAASASTGR